MLSEIEQIAIFEKALLELFTLIDSPEIITHIHSEILRSHEAQKRGETVTLSKLAQACLIAVKDNLVSGRPFVVDHAKMWAHMRARTAALN